MAVVFLIFTFLFSLSANAYEVDVLCRPKARCGDIDEKVQAINEKDWESFDDFLDEIKKMSLSFDVQYFSFDFEPSKSVFVKVEKKPLVREIEFKGRDIDEDQALKRLPVKTGFPYPDVSNKSIVDGIEVWLKENGYTYPKARYEKHIKDDKYEIKIYIDYADILTIKKVKLTCDVKVYCEKVLKETFNQFKGEPYKTIDIKSFTNRIKREITAEGFPDAKLNYASEIKNNEVILNFDLTLGERIQYTFAGDLVDSETVLRDYIRKESSGYDFNKMKETISLLIKKKYKDYGYFSTEVEVRKVKFVTKDGVNANNYYTYIKKGYRYKVSSVSFLGNSVVINERLEELYRENATVLTNRGIYDEKYVYSFKDTLREFYLKIGFVYVEVADPEIHKNDEEKTVKIIYGIKERQRSIVQEIKLNGLNKKLISESKKIMVNKENEPLNIIALEQDILSVLSVVRNSGYYYARLVDSGDVVKYSSNFTESEINLSFFTGKKAILDEVVLTGNTVTKEEVLLREIKIHEGELVTPKLIKNTKDALNSLGLFSQVSITPVINSKISSEDYQVRLVVEVKEREFGRVEVAPGFRSDLGAKFSLSFLKNNLWGLNHSFQSKLLLNRRFSFSGIDQSRIKDGHKVEGLLKLSYSWPYLFKSIFFDTSLSFQRRRFFAFDADIARLSPQFAKKWNDVVSTTLKYQFEQIRQYDSINDSDNANFRIGGITPSITFDFRDSPIEPRSGSFFGLSWEYAAPALGSQNDESIEINFSKVISRNKFYIPVAKKKFVFAINLALGYQKNYATDLQKDQNGDEIPISETNDTPRTRGYIPSIKVFRLDGFDLVRGFSDNEINRLEEGIDITLTRVQGEAYFANFKFEPRYYINNNFVFGVFFDAGRVFVNSFKPLALRSAVGVTMKLLTPVGSLDFDYGVKTNPRVVASGAKEGFGRFHLNVGTF